MIPPVLIKNSRVARAFRVHAIVLYPFIFFAEKNPGEVLMNHEMIHVEQIRRLGFVKFYYQYLKQYFFLRLKGSSHHQAYHGISFEQEAYANQNNLDYNKKGPIA